MKNKASMFVNSILSFIAIAIASIFAFPIGRFLARICKTDSVIYNVGYIMPFVISGFCLTASVLAMIFVTIKKNVCKQSETNILRFLVFFISGSAAIVVVLCLSRTPKNAIEVAAYFGILLLLSFTATHKIKV